MSQRSAINSGGAVSPAPQDRIVYHGSRVDMVLRTVTTTSGKQIEREIVVHPGSVIILPVLRDGNLVLIRNLRHTVGGDLWELPAGTLEKGEDPARCAERELTEETGYRAAEIVPFGWFYTSPGILTEKMFAFIAAGLSAGTQALEDNETIQVEIVTPDHTLAMIRDNKIVDAKTIAIVLKYLSATVNT
ncbi:MAG: NUDIX hydrolase [Phycisphaerae bacterium]|nr:NUDIX hydrolase [Phycisphaerae bacterium]